MEKSEIEQILKILFKRYKVSKTTLNRMRQNANPYKVLIACLLSLRTRDENTEKVTTRLFEIADTPEKILEIPIDKLESLIFSSGHYKKKAQTLKHVSKEIQGRFNGKVPDTKEELLSIKGIGPKTANVVLAFAYNKNVIPVDVNVHRVVNRIGIVDTKVAEKTEIALNDKIPRKYWKEFNSVFIQFGREICLPVSPWCSKCPLSKECPKIGVVKRR